jgi:hypothetical protein
MPPGSRDDPTYSQNLFSSQHYETPFIRHINHELVVQGILPQLPLSVPFPFNLSVTSFWCLGVSLLAKPLAHFPGLLTASLPQIPVNVVRDRIRQ